MRKHSTSNLHLGHFRMSKNCTSKIIFYVFVQRPQRSLFLHDKANTIRNWKCSRIQGGKKSFFFLFLSSPFFFSEKSCFLHHKTFFSEKGLFLTIFFQTNPVFLQVNPFFIRPTFFVCKQNPIFSYSKISNIQDLCYLLMKLVIF